MKRRKARENAFIAMFEMSYGAPVQEVIDYSREAGSEYEVDDFGDGLLKAYAGNTDEIDEAISAKLKGWKMDRLPRVNLAILRLSVAEMLYTGSEDMDSIIINEAVELAKKYGDDGDHQFINGVLGTFSREKGGEAQESAPAAEAETGTDAEAEAAPVQEDAGE